MWRDHIRRVTPYTPGEQPDNTDVIKLNTNENPYPPSERVRDLIKSMDPASLRRYPDPSVRQLRAAIADYHGLSIDNVFVGVGSDDVIAMCYMTFFNSKWPILFPDITYSFYDVWAEEFDVPYELKALSDDFTIKAIDYKCPNGGIIIPNPNAPTGIAQGVELFREIIDSNRDSIVIIDEAYVDFGAESVIELLGEYDNLIVVRTFSKSRSLAGSRIGYALSSEEIIKAIMDVKYSFNSYTIDSVTMRLGEEAIKDDAYFRETTKRIIATRRRLTDELRSMGFYVYPSSANFIFVRPPVHSAKKLYEMLKCNNILVRHFDKPRINDCLRISIGTDEETDTLIASLKDILG